MLQISADGYLSFGKAVTCCSMLDANGSAEYIVAPFLADTSVVAGVGNISYQVINNSSNSALLNQVSKFIRQKNNNSFAGTWMLVVQWKNVSQFGQPTAKVFGRIIGYRFCFKCYFNVADQYISRSGNNKWISVICSVYL